MRVAADFARLLRQSVSGDEYEYKSKRESSEASILVTRPSLLLSCSPNNALPQRTQCVQNQVPSKVTSIGDSSLW